MTFAGRIVLVTGAASGIGAAFARLAAGEGAAGLALLDRNGDGLAALAESLDCPSVTAAGDAGDVGDAAAWSRFEADIAARFGRVDFALAGAGIGHAMTPIAELDPEAWSRVIGVNLTGVFLTLRTSLRLMADGGAITLIASSMGVKPSANTAGYGASKAALIHLAKIAALEAAIFREQAFFGALVGQTGSERGAFDALAARTPLGRYASAEETAGLIAFLMSDAAAQVTGANLIADAGMTL